MGESDKEEGLDLDFDTGNGEDADEGGIELDLSDTSDEVDDLSVDIGETEVEAEEDANIEPSQEISFDIGAEEGEAPEIDLSLDDGDMGSESEEDANIEPSQEISFDIGAEEGEAPEIDLSLDDVDMGSESEEDVNIEPSQEISFDIGAEEGEVPEIDLNLDGEESSESGKVVSMDQTVEMPKIDMDTNKADDSNGENRTVFVPRSVQPEEQSVEDEIATKLDLAKAYVELGDKDSAKTILDEVMAEGDDNQRQQAQELLGQI
jgi:pilus assembly protein FimV